MFLSYIFMEMDTSGRFISHTSRMRIFWQVQVDQGGYAPPIKVTVGGTRGAEVCKKMMISYCLMTSFVLIGEVGCILRSMRSRNSSSSLYY